MSQRERDRLKVLHEASTGQITQKQASEQLRISERQVRRLVKKLKQTGDRAVIHGLRGRVSNRRIAGDQQQRAMDELSRPECADFGPTFAAEHLRKHLQMEVGKDTVRKWMITAGLWKPERRKPGGSAGYGSRQSVIAPQFAVLVASCATPEQLKTRSRNSGCPSSIIALVTCTHWLVSYDRWANLEAMCSQLSMFNGISVITISTIFISV